MGHPLQEPQEQAPFPCFFLRIMVHKTAISARNTSPSMTQDKEFIVFYHSPPGVRNRMRMVAT